MTLIVLVVLLAIVLGGVGIVNEAAELVVLAALCVIIALSIGPWYTRRPPR